MKKSNQNPIGGDSFAFGPFQLDARQRILTRKGQLLSIKPKVFDLLLLLVSHAGHVVGKEQIRKALWPDVHVEDANVTNAITAIRRLLGRNAIRTSSKHGYRFDLKLTAQPGVPPAVAGLLDEAQAMFARQTVASIAKARDLCCICLAEMPHFAEAWAWLGRSSRWLAKYGTAGEESLQLAEAAFRRALLIDPESDSAHQFYTIHQVDQGQAVAAMHRLIERARKRHDDPRTFVALIHVLRYCGLLAESLAAHQRLLQLRPSLPNSVAHTRFNLCDFPGVIESYAGPDQERLRGYLDLAAWAAAGNTQRAAQLAAERLAGNSLPQGLRHLVAGLLDTIENRTSNVPDCLDVVSRSGDAEGAFYHARHLCYSGHLDQCAELLSQAVIGKSYGCAYALTHDPWLEKLRFHPRFPHLLRDAERTVSQARLEWKRASGDLLLAP